MKTHHKKSDATTWVTTAFLFALVGAAYYIRQHHEPVESAKTESGTATRTISGSDASHAAKTVMAHWPSTPSTISREN